MKRHSIRPTPSIPSTSQLLGAALLGGFVATFLSRNFFESEKKVTHEIVLDYGVEDEQFVRTISQLMGPPLIDGNSIEVLGNGAEIFPAMLEAIRSAKRTITLENFVFSHGRITTQFAEALAESSRNGVAVHFLQDAMGCNCLRGEEFQLLEAAGAKVEIFRYFHLRFNERTHRKLLIIDGRIGFIGGVGISDEWDGNADHPGCWRDLQYRVRGPVVAQMQQAFLDNWMQTRGEVLHGEAYFPALRNEGRLLSQVFQSSSCEGADSARLMFLFSIAAARRTIRIANAYFIPDDLTIQTLLDARKRGVDIEIITPCEHIDQRVVRYVGRSRWGCLLESGVRFYEFQPARYHCKYMIIDDAWCSVGSCNFDNRSLRLNEEANLNILDQSFARAHAAIFERDRDQSKHITLTDWRNRPLSEKIQGHAGCLLRSQL